jgi:hypothetical protein
MATGSTTTGDLIADLVGLLLYTTVILSLVAVAHHVFSYQRARQGMAFVSIALLASTYYDTDWVIVLVKWVVYTEVNSWIDSVVYAGHAQNLCETIAQLQALLKREAERNGKASAAARKTGYEVPAKECTVDVA